MNNLKRRYTMEKFIGIILLIAVSFLGWYAPDIINKIKSFNIKQ